MNNDVFSFQNNQNLNLTNSTLEINLTKDQIKKLYEQVKYVNNSVNKINKINYVTMICFLMFTLIFSFSIMSHLSLLFSLINIGLVLGCSAIFAMCGYINEKNKSILKEFAILPKKERDNIVKMIEQCYANYTENKSLILPLELARTISNNKNFSNSKNLISTDLKHKNISPFIIEKKDKDDIKKSIEEGKKAKFSQQKTLTQNLAFNLVSNLSNVEKEELQK